MSEEWKREIEAVIAADDEEDLLGVVIDIAMAAEDPAWAIDRLIGLAAHADSGVRGNALAGFPKLADRFPAIDRAKFIAVLRAAREDEKIYVREQAEAALAELGEPTDD